MLSLHWLSRFWSPRSSEALRRERPKERRLRLLRLEQRRVLNADFSFLPNGSLTLSHVDGELSIREIGTHVEFDLAGSVWQNTGTSVLTIDNSVANHSILAVEKTDLETLRLGVMIGGADSSHNLTLETQSNALDLHLMAGSLTIQGFGDVQQVGPESFLVHDLSITADDDVTLENTNVSGSLAITAEDSILLNGTIEADSATLTASQGFIAGGGLLSAQSVDLHAETGIRGGTLTESLSLSATSISAVNLGDFDVRLSNANTHNTSVTELTTEGGDLVFAQSSGGDVTFVGGLSSGGHSGGSITLFSDGRLTIADAIDTLDSGEGTGGTLLLGNATIHREIHAGDGDITILGGDKDLLLFANVSSTGSIELQADRDVIVLDSIQADGAASDLTITADDNHDGSGGFWLKETPFETDAQLQAGRDVHIFGANLRATFDSLDSVRIDADGAAQQIVAGRDLTLLANIGAGPALAGDIILDGQQTAAGSLTVFSNHRILLGADQTVGGDVLFKNEVQLTNDVAIKSGGEIVFDRTLDDDGSDATGSALTVTAVNDVIFVDKVGANVGDRLDSLTVSDARSVDFLSSITLEGDLHVTTQSSADPSEGRINFHGAVTINAGLATGSVEIHNAGPLIISSQAEFLVAGSFTQNGFGGTELGANITTLGGDVFFSDTVLLTESVSIDSNASDGDITFRGSINSEDNGVVAEHNSLTLAAGTGEISFGSDLGAGTLGDQTLGNLTVLSAKRVVFGAFVDGAPGTAGPLTQILLDGAMDIGVGGNVVENGIIFDTGSGSINLATTDDVVRLNGPVSLLTSLNINTNTTGDGGAVTFTSAASINGESDNSNGLTIDAGRSRVVFNNDIGRTSKIGVFTITQADAGVIFGEDDTDQGPGTTGPVTTIITDGEINIGVDEHVIVGGIVLNGGLSTLRIETTDRTVRFNGPLTIESDVDINTNANFTGIPTHLQNTTFDIIGGTLTFTSDTTIDSQDGECNDLTIDVGKQQVLFNANLGVGVFGDQKLGKLTITQADDGVIFGESDVHLGPGLTGPVTAIATCEAIDIGMANHVIGGAGIVFNGGDETLHLTTEDASVRLNGAVTLNSDLEIDTNAAIDTGGGTVTFTSAATIDSETGEASNLTIDAGTEQVLFNNDLGAINPLGALTITQADFGVRFGQAGIPGESDLGQHSDELGLVNTIATDGPIDIGVGSHVITGGIVLNNGDGTLDLSTTDDTVRFNGFVTLASDVDINTNFTPLSGGATVTFTEAAMINSLRDETLDIDDNLTYDEHNDLTIDVGVAQVLFNNDIGTVQSLGALTITQADFGVIFGQSDTDLGPGTTGPVGWIITDDAIDIGVGDHVIDGAGIVLNAGVESQLIATTDDTVRFNGAVRLGTNLDINTNATGTGGTVTFTESATIDSETGQFYDLTIDVGTQQALFNNNLGESQSLGTFTIEQADAGVIFGENEERQGPGTTGPVTIITTSGPIDIGVGEHVIAGGIVFNAGEGLLLITTAGDPPPLLPEPDQLPLPELPRPVRFNGPITLISDVEINTHSDGFATEDDTTTDTTFFIGGRTVLFTSAATIDSGPLGEAQNLTIDAGTQQVLFNNNLGEINPLGQLTITQADDGVIFGQTDTDQGPGTTGPVTIIATDDAIDIGVGTNTITASARDADGGETGIIVGIVFNAGGDTLQITTTDDPIRLNGPITLQSNLDINTNTSGIGDDVTFTSAATIDSQATPDDEHNDLVIDVGTGALFFNNNIGATQSLGSFTITQADSGVTFGQDDQFERPGLLGPVNTIITEGPIDIGVGDNVITDGIHLNGGLQPVSELIPVLIESHLDSIRFNGLIVSQVEPLDMDGIPVHLPEVDLTINAATGVLLTNASGILTDDYNVVINGDTDDDSVGDVVMEEQTRILAEAGFINLRGSNVMLGEIETTNGNRVGDTNPAVRITATFGAIVDINDFFDEDMHLVEGLNIVARTVASDTDRAGVVLDALLGIGSGNALETHVKSLIAFNHDLDIDGDDVVDTPADGNIELHDLGGLAEDLAIVDHPRTGSEHKVDLVFVHNHANPLETGDPDRGVIDINIELGDLRVLEDGSLPLLDELINGIDPGNLALAAVQSENTIRLTANTIEIADDLLAIQDEPATADEIFEIIELNARADFFLESGRVISTDQDYAGSLAFSFEDLNQNRLLDLDEDTNENFILDYDADPKPKILADDFHKDVIHITADFDRNGRTVSTVVVIDSNFPLSPLIDRVIVDMNRNGVLDVDLQNNGEDNSNGYINEDTNNNGLLDTGEDTNLNGLLDVALENLSEDVNQNGDLDIEDTNKNGVLDPGEDVNDNGRLDTEDTNGNGLLDVASDGKVFLGEGATISTNSGIEQQVSIRPDVGMTDTAFFEHDLVIASNLESNGEGPSGELLLGTIRVPIGKPGEKNLIVDFDWGDLTPPFLDNVLAPTLQLDGSYLFDVVIDKTNTRYLIPEGGLIYEFPHEYTNLALNFPEGQPGRVLPSDPFLVRFSVSQHTSILIEGRAIAAPDDESILTNVPLSAPLEPGIIPLALLSTTDVRDNPALLLPRFDNGVIEFTIPTSKSFALPLNRAPDAPPPEPPRFTAPPPAAPTPPQATTETNRGAAASSSVSTDEYFELRLINEDGSLESKQKLNGKNDGELLLNNRDLFEEFVREKSDGDYEIWFITKDIREGALIERPVIQFRLESGRVSPQSDDALQLLKPFQLIPIPVDRPPDADGNADRDDNDRNANAESNGQPDADVRLEESPADLPTIQTIPDPFFDPTTDTDESEELSERLSPSSSAALTAGVLFFATTHRRPATKTSSLFSKTSRITRKLISSNS